jgi:hypothetical protein
LEDKNQLDPQSATSAYNTNFNYKIVSIFLSYSIECLNFSRFGLRAEMHSPEPADYLTGPPKVCHCRLEDRATETGGFL